MRRDFCVGLRTRHTSLLKAPLISSKVVLAPAFCHLSTHYSNTPLHNGPPMSLLEVGDLCMVRRLGRAQLALLLAIAAPLCAACGSDESPPPAPAPSSVNSALAGAPSVSANDSATSRGNGTACTEQQLRECRVELRRQGTVQNCFVGLQLCSKGVWGPCLSAAEIEAQLNTQ